MKLLFNGLIENSTLSSQYPSNSYPLSNLQDSFLTRRYQSSRDSDVIMIAFESESDVDCFFWGYTNAIQIIFGLYDYENTLLYQQVIDNPYAGVDSIYFDTVEDASYALVTLSYDSLGVYIGRCDCGIASVYPDPLEDYELDFSDATISNKSPNGQTSFDRAEPLEILLFEFKGIDPDVMDGIISDYIYYGIGRPLFIDPFDLNHDFMMPKYGTMQRPLGYKKNGINREFTLEIEESS
jgi:hypothetical protein